MKKFDSDLMFRRSSACLPNPSPSCVEVSTGGGEIVVRDSKDPSGGTLVFTKDEWLAFVAGVKKGEFDV